MTTWYTQLVQCDWPRCDEAGTYRVCVGHAAIEFVMRGCWCRQHASLLIDVLQSTSERELAPKLSELVDRLMALPPREEAAGP